MLKLARLIQTNNGSAAFRVSLSHGFIIHCFKRRMRDAFPSRIAPQRPWENVYAERLIRSLKESLLRKCLFTSEAALRLALVEFQTYFNYERPHQGI